MSPPPRDPDSGKIDVTPEDVAAGAKTFGKAQDDLYNAWYALQTALDQNSGMAGNDDVARTFDARYAKGVAAAWNVLHQGCLTFGGISKGLTTTANNFVKADHHSTVGGSRQPPPLFAPEPVFDDVSMATVNSALGPGQGGLPGPLAKYWPNADTGKVRAAARAWHTAAEAIGGINGRADTAMTGLTSTSDDDSAQAIREFWAGVYRAGDPRTVLDGMHHICVALGDACDKYAKSVDDVHDRMKAALIGAGVAIAVITAAGVLLTVFTGGASDAAAAAGDAATAEAVLEPIAAEAAATVGTDVAATVSEELVGTVEAAAADAPTVEAVEAETSEIEGALDEEMADAEVDPDPNARLSGPERDTLNRIREEYPDRDFKASTEERDGEYTDGQGRTYDQMGDPKASQYWNPRSAQKFYRAIDAHLNKSMDFTVIDLTGFSEQSASDIASYVDSLPADLQAKIIRIGF
jgi:hypothetical protein